MLHFNFQTMSAGKKSSGGGGERVGRWYFGGLASAGAACCTHPLDLLKVHLQESMLSRSNPIGSAKFFVFTGVKDTRL